MSSYDKKSLINENRRLKQRVDAAQEEIAAIKGSRAYGTIRLLGHVKNQIKESPVGFSKKVVKKVLTKGGLMKGTESARKNLNLHSTLQEQYETWIALNEPDQQTLDDQVKKSTSFVKRPLISIVTPVFNPPKDVFIELIESVRSQTYDNFELCLGNFGDNQEVKDVIAEYAKKDSRIKDLSFTENKGIAENSNQILAKVNGEYIALLDHDDTLSHDALYENVKLLNEDDYDFIYSDKDKIDEKGKRFDPFFKPDWSPEIMLNANYLTHLNLMRTSIVNKVGGWDSDTDGAQDWDIFLKVIAASKKVAHIPKVLYHWRVIATSTAFSIETKPYALAGQRFAVDKYLKKIKVNGKSYHVGAELLIEWPEVTAKPVLFVKSHNSAYLRELFSDISSGNAKELTENVKEVVIFHDYAVNFEQPKNSTVKLKLVPYVTGEYLHTLTETAAKLNEDTILFYDDRIQTNVSSREIQNLSGWLQINGVKAVAPRINQKNNFALDAGAVITAEGIKPLFNNSPPYHQAAIGNVEWVRDMRILNPYVFVTKSSYLLDVQKLVNKKVIDDDIVHTAIHLALSSDGRLVFDPKVNVSVREANNIEVLQYYDEASSLLDMFTNTEDPYMNPNLSAEDPMNLTKIVQSLEADDPEPEQSYGYHNEAMVHALNRRLSERQLAENFKHIHDTSKQALNKIETVLFILPDFQAIYAGLNNIFFFAENMRKKQGIKVTVALMSGDKTLDRQRELIRQKYPELADTIDLIKVDPFSVSKLPAVDVAICTQWATAYILALYNRSKRKCYFIQDKESSFYPKGSISALVDNTYGFGFYGLANTEGLLHWYKTDFGGKGIVLRSSVDLTSYAPPTKLNLHPKAPYKVFFYARPNEPRNAFEIGVASLIELKRRLGKDLEVYAAGAEWDPIDYSLSDTVINLGKIAYDKLPEFYRSMDAGMMLMFSGHPGVVASELMASGTPAVVNAYDDLTWHELYKNGETAIVSTVTADAVADNFERILKDAKVREKVITGGLEKVAEFYGHYDESFELVIKVLKSKI